MNTNRGFIPILAILIVAVIAVGGGYWVYQEVGGDVDFNLPPIELSNDEGNFTTPSPKPFTPTQPVACTMEAKICPDGSAVGRTGPKCEFAACPNNVTRSLNPTQQELNNYVEFLKKYDMDFSMYNNPADYGSGNLFGVTLIVQTTETVIPKIISGLKDYAYTYRQGFWDKKGYSGKDYKDVCTSPEFSELINNLKIAVGPGNVICNSDINNYAASTMLPSGHFWCVDSSGYDGPGKQLLNKQVSCTKETP